jgi:lipopolysaccharide export LptBFGC system permease protein LptF
MAILLFFLLVLTSSVFLALGKGARIDPLVAAWGPVLLFGAVGALMLWMRSTNRELPNILS